MYVFICMYVCMSFFCVVLPCVGRSPYGGLIPHPVSPSKIHRKIHCLRCFFFFFY
jgi:hypothetical protein